jgi:hypothetical protein
MFEERQDLLTSSKENKQDSVRPQMKGITLPDNDAKSWIMPNLQFFSNIRYTFMGPSYYK